MCKSPEVEASSVRLKSSHKSCWGERTRIMGGCGWVEAGLGGKVKCWNFVTVGWGKGGVFSGTPVSAVGSRSHCSALVGVSVLGHTYLEHASSHLHSGKHEFESRFYLLPTTMIIKLPLTLKTHCLLLPR